MDIKGKFAFVGLSAVVVMIAALAGCLGGDDDEKELSMEGSTTVLPIAQAAAEKYMEDNPDATINVKGGGSSTGVEAAGTGSADIGMASRELKDSEKSEYPDIMTKPIAKDGIAVIVHPDNNVSALTMDQLKQIYLGEITNWQDVGGADEAIVVVGRDSASGTRGTFDDLVIDGENPTTDMQQKQSNGDVFNTIKTTPQAIGYVGLGYLNDEVQGVSMDGVERSVSIVVDGSYPISRNLIFVFDGEPDGFAKEFLDYVLGPEGQAIVEEEGFVPLS